jgi:hypothetical protein
MVLADDKRGNGRTSNNTLQGLPTITKNFPRPYIFAVFWILPVFLLTTFTFHLLSPGESNIAVL